MRAKLVNEKFTEDSDPIRDMGIGIFHPHDFKNRKEFDNFLADVLPFILKKDTIPEDILNDPGVYISHKYVPQILNYIEKYCTIEGHEADFWFEPFHLLLKKQYPELLSWIVDGDREYKPITKLKTNTVSEKFIENSDPVKDMGIGLKGAEIWAQQMVSALEDHKVTQFGGSIPIEDIELVMSNEYSADVIGSIKVGNVTFNLYFNIRDNRRWNADVPKWESEISMTSSSKKGMFVKKVTGKNTSPSNLLNILSDIFNLKYSRR